MTAETLLARLTAIQVADANNMGSEPYAPEQGEPPDEPLPDANILAFPRAVAGPSFYSILRDSPYSGIDLFYSPGPTSGGAQASAYNLKYGLIFTLDQTEGGDRLAVHNASGYSIDPTDDKVTSDGTNLGDGFFFISPNYEYLFATSDSDDNNYLYNNMSDLTQRVDYGNTLGGIESGCFSADSSMLCLAVGDTTTLDFNVYDVASSALLYTGSDFSPSLAGLDHIQAVQPMPGTNYILVIVYANENTNGRLYDLTTQQQVGGDLPMVIPYNADISPDGSKMVAAHYDGTISVWDISASPSDPSGWTSITITPNANRDQYGRYPTFSPDGEQIAYMMRDTSSGNIHLTLFDATVDPIIVETEVDTFSTSPNMAYESAALWIASTETGGGS